MKIPSIVFVLSLCIITSCSTTQKKPDIPSRVSPEYNEGSVESVLENGHWITLPRNGDLVIIGVSNRQRQRKDEIRLALDDAARKVAFFHGIKGKIFEATTNGSGFLDYSMDIDYEFDYDTGYEKYIDALKYDVNRDVLSIDGALLLRVHYKLRNPLNVNYHFNEKDGKPEWIGKPPDEISGYMAAIGYAGPHSRFKDTVSKAYENAIASIIKRLSVESSGNISTSGDGSTVMSEVQISEGELKEFFVLEMWHDHTTNGVWVLAIAKQKQ
jgi:hypothetical protein